MAYEGRLLSSVLGTGFNRCYCSDSDTLNRTSPDKEVSSVKAGTLPAWLRPLVAVLGAALSAQSKLMNG